MWLGPDTGSCHARAVECVAVLASAHSPVLSLRPGRLGGHLSAHMVLQPRGAAVQMAGPAFGQLLALLSLFLSCPSVARGRGHPGRPPRHCVAGLWGPTASPMNTGLIVFRLGRGLRPALVLVEWN